jgi:hypothetical protein
MLHWHRTRVRASRGIELTSGVVSPVLGKVEFRV